MQYFVTSKLFKVSLTDLLLKNKNWEIQFLRGKPYFFKKKEIFVRQVADLLWCYNIQYPQSIQCLFKLRMTCRWKKDKGMWMLLIGLLFFMFSNFYWLELLPKTHVALANLQWNIYKNRIENRTSPNYGHHTYMHVCWFFSKDR